MNDRETEPMRKIHEIRIRLWEEERTLAPEERMKRSKKRLEHFVKENKLEHRIVSRPLLKI